MQVYYGAGINTSQTVEQVFMQNRGMRAIHAAFRDAFPVSFMGAEPPLQTAPDLPAPCQLISAFQKSSRGTMERLTPPYKPGEGADCQ